MDIKDLKRKAESNDIVAMREIAKAFIENRDSLGNEIDEDEAFDYIQKAANLGDAEAQYMVASFMSSNEEYEDAFYWTLKSAEQGYSKAQNDAGYMYQHGVGTAKDPNKQFFWYKKAAENGETVSKCCLADCYLHGVGIAQDFQKAIFWFEQSANEGYPAAKRKMGAIYLMGEHILYNKEKGMALLQEAANLGDNQAKELIKSPELTGNKEGCYIATCVYGSYNAHEVLILRRFRDKILSESILGRLFIKCYYHFSPSIAESLKGKKAINKHMRIIIDRIVLKLDKK